MKNILMILMTGCITLLLASCAKEQISADKYYYGKAAVKLANFPGSQPLDVYFDNQKLGKLGVNTTTAFQVPAGKSGHFSLKAAGTDSVKMDTLISVPRDKTISLTVAYSKASGISGFLNIDQPISADSLGVQFLNGFSYDKNPGRLRIKIMYFDTNGNILFTGSELQLDRNQLASQVIKLPKQFPGGAPGQGYIVELYDAVTGVAVINSAFGLPDCLMDTFPGHIYIVKIDDYGGTSFTAQALPL